MKDSFNFWIDLENPPDVLFFQPIASRLREMDHKVYVTKRIYSGVSQLGRLYGLHGDEVGWYGGKMKMKKIAVGLMRSYLLARWLRGKSIDLAVGFGSRPLAITCGLLGIHNATVFDYEHVSIGALNRFCDWIIVPQQISTQYLIQRGTSEKKILKYPGLKEEAYTAIYRHDKALMKRLGYDEKKVIVTLRPPATRAHYHDPVAEIVCRRVLETISNDSSVHAIFLRRDNDSTFDEFLPCENITALTVPVKGLDLVANSDVVISGGGTMVREAAALEVPAYSIFTGRLGKVDEQLSNEGRLVLIRNPEDVTKIQFIKRDKKVHNDRKNVYILEFFVSEFIRLAGNSRT